MAFEYLTRAADQGNAHATHQLGVRYLYAVGVEQDLDKAIEHFDKAIELGLADAVKDREIAQKKKKMSFTPLIKRVRSPACPRAGAGRNGGACTSLRMWSALTAHEEPVVVAADVAPVDVRAVARQPADVACRLLAEEAVPPPTAGGGGAVPAAAAAAAAKRRQGGVRAEPAGVAAVGRRRADTDGAGAASTGRRSARPCFSRRRRSEQSLLAHAPMLLYRATDGCSASQLAVARLTSLASHFTLISGGSARELSIGPDKLTQGIGARRLS